jgi:M6 family metalloprotease-like protein
MRRFFPALAVVFGSLLTDPAGAQDIEVLSRLSGIPLPAAYYQQIQRSPDMFEFTRGLMSRVELGSTAARGEVRLPVVLGLFNDSPEVPHITREMVQASLFSGPAERGTITEAYLEMSSGALTVNGDVYGWARSALSMAEVVGDSDGLGSNTQMGLYMLDVLDALDPEIDFALYDSDGPDGVANSGDDDGFVDVITFEYLEIAASCGGPAIWPHRSSMSGRTGSPYATDDFGIDGGTIFVQDYITQSAANCSGDVVQDAAVMSHEFGHALGLPDYYHWIDRGIGPYGRRWVLGCWALMAAGSWGCGPVTEERAPFGPTHMMAFSKSELGWLDFMDIGEVWNEDIVLGPVQTTGDALRIPMGENGTEFLIAEYRGLVGFDSQLPGAGVLLYKQDLQGSRQPSTTSGTPYFLELIEQDNNQSMLKLAAEGGSRGEIGDAWGLGVVRGKLTAESSPALVLSDGGRTPVVVHEVYVEGGEAHLVLSTGRTPRLFPPTEAIEVPRVRTFLAPIRIGGGTGPYSGEGDLPEGFSLESVGDELMLVGSVRSEGPHDFVVAVRDVLGSLSDQVSFAVTAPTEWAVEVDDLLQRFLLGDGPPLSPGELRYLDEVGNGNGTYDVGDLRKWLREMSPAQP